MERNRQALERCGRCVVLALSALTACGDAVPGPGASGAAVTVAAASGYQAVVTRLEAMIEREREQKGLRAVSIALVDGDDVVWARGFGEQSEGVPASAETVYRVGSVSKMFTDIAIMQLVERGEIDIDGPVREYVPELRGRMVALRPR